MRMTSIAVVALLSATAPALAQTTIDAARADAAVREAFPTAPADWQSRLTPDETMRQCSAHRNNPPKAVADAIREREKATIVYPPDGKFLGDWKKGEELAQSGYGLRFTDYPARRANGGNCYACHQLTKRELSYGTVGPSLLAYGKLRDYKEADIKTTYERIYNSHSAFACSNMPRFGANKILTVEQIKDAVALLMSPDSPVNAGQ
jgi:L-cysteine S-thiosulfotransferase